MTERQYKDSGIEWIGDIPNDWDVKRIKYAVVEMGSGTTPSSDNSHFYGGDIPWIQSGDLYNTPLITKTSKTVTEQAFQSCSALKIFHKPYIVIAMYGASVGNVSMSLIDACTNQACCVIKPNANNNLAYLKYWLEICKTDFINKSVGGGQPNISQDKIREQAYICPSLEEQQQIADFLDSKTASIDSAIQAQKDIVEKLKEYRQSVITEAVTKGLNPDAEMKDSGIEWIGEVPKNWDILRMKHVAWLKGRIGWDGLKAEEFVENGPYLITGTDFENGKVNWETCVHITKARFKEDELLHIRENDLLITKDGTVGKVAVAKDCPNEVSLNSGVMIIRNNSKYRFHGRYMYYLLLSEEFIKWFELKQKPGSTIRHLYQHQFENFRFTFPPFDEQQKIADFLDSKTATIDKAIEQKNAIIEKLEEYKKSIIYNAVTGKIDCRKDVIPE